MHTCLYLTFYNFWMNVLVPYLILQVDDSLLFLSLSSSISKQKYFHKSQLKFVVLFLKIIIIMLVYRIPASNLNSSAPFKLLLLEIIVVTIRDIQYCVDPSM